MLVRPADNRGFGNWSSADVPPTLRRIAGSAASQAHPARRGFSISSRHTAATSGLRSFVREGLVVNPDELRSGKFNLRFYCEWFPLFVANAACCAGGETGLAAI